MRELWGFECRAMGMERRGRGSMVTVWEVGVPRQSLFGALGTAIGTDWRRMGWIGAGIGEGVAWPSGNRRPGRIVVMRTRSCRRVVAGRVVRGRARSAR